MHPTKSLQRERRTFLTGFRKNVDCPITHKTKTLSHIYACTYTHAHTLEYHNHMHSTHSFRHPCSSSAIHFHRLICFHWAPSFPSNIYKATWTPISRPVIALNRRVINLQGNGQCENQWLSPREPIARPDLKGTKGDYFLFLLLK